MDKVAVVAVGLLIGVAFFLYESWNSDEQRNEPTGYQRQQRQYQSRRNEQTGCQQQQRQSPSRRNEQTGYQQQQRQIPSRSDEHTNLGYQRQQRRNQSPSYCPICLDEKDYSERKYCQHCQNFCHKKCFQKWINQGGTKTCPLCRRDVQAW